MASSLQARLVGSKLSAPLRSDTHIIMPVCSTRDIAREDRHTRRQRPRERQTDYSISRVLLRRIPLPIQIPIQAPSQTYLHGGLVTTCSCTHATPSPRRALVALVRALLHVVTDEAPAVVDREEEVCEDHREYRHQLHQDVERRARGILEGI